MLSILISTYNQPCFSLVCDLHQQAEELKAIGGFCFEIIVSDDASPSQEVVAYNQQIATLPHCRFFRQPQNKGGALSRNWLAAQSQYPYLLFIDSDAAVGTTDFLKKYWLNREAALVVCGGLTNPTGKAPEGCELRYYYEKAADRYRTLAFRRHHPELFLTAFNLLFHRTVFDMIQFDERCTGYGYEDTLLGFELSRKGIAIHHIDNPLIHTGIDSTTSFIRKTQTALQALHRLGEPLQSEVGASRWAKKLDRYKITQCVYFIYQWLQPFILWQLNTSRPLLPLFAFYKLGYYLSLESKVNRG